MEHVDSTVIAIRLNGSLGGKGVMLPTSMRTEGLYQDLAGDWITCFFTASFVPGLQLKILAQQFNGFRVFPTKGVKGKNLCP